MKCPYACHSADPLPSRRSRVAGLAAGAGAIASGLGGALAATPGVADQIKAKHKRILNVFMHGGVSQLESWDPKPQTDTGGPFRAIPTSVPGIHISELLPLTAQQVQHLCLVRGVNTSEDDHGKGAYMMLHGRRQTPASDYPTLGAVAAKALTPTD